MTLKYALGHGFMADTLVAGTIRFRAILCNSAVAAILVLIWVALLLEQMVRGVKHCDTDVRNVTEN